MAKSGETKLSQYYENLIFELLGDMRPKIRHAD